MKSKNSFTQNHLAAATALYGLVVLSGCFFSEKPSSTGPSQKGSTALIEGHVIGEASLNKSSRRAAGVKGAAVFVAQVQADGSLKEVSEARVTTDASGYFAVEAALDGVRELVVVAKEEAREWKSVVSGEVKKGKKMASRPLNTESSLEAEVFAQIHADGQAGLVHFSQIATHIDAQVAAKVTAENKAEAKIAFARALTAAAKARKEVLMATGATAASLEKVAEAEAKAQADLEADLHASIKGTGTVAAAYENHRKTRFKAYTDANVRLNAFGQAQEASLRTFLKTQNQMQEQLRLALAHNMAEWQARASAASAQAEFKAAGASQIHIDALVKAEVDLVVSIRASEKITGIDSAFIGYRKSLWAEFQTAFAEQAAAMIALKDSSTASATLEADLKVAVTDEEVAKAYARYYTKLNQEAAAGLSGMDAAIKLKFASLGETAVHLRGNGETHVGEIPNLPVPVPGDTTKTEITVGIKVNGSLGGDIEANTVILVQVQADGSLKTVSDKEATVDAEGKFQLETKLKSASDLMVVAKDEGGREWKLIVEGDDTASVRNALELNAETAAEAELFLHFRKEGKTSIQAVEAARLRMDAELGAALAAKSDIAAKVGAVFSAGDEARLRYLIDIETEVSEAEAKVLLETSVKAEADLKTEWKAAASDVAKLQVAGKVYVKTMTDAYAKAEAGAQAFAVAQEAYARALLKQAAELEGEARLIVTRRAMRTKALAVSAAVTAQFQASGASEGVITALDAATLSLVQAIDSATSPEAMAQAFTAFHAAVVVQLQAQFSVHSGGIAGANHALHTEGGAKADFAAEFSGAATSAVAVKTYAGLHAAAAAELKSALALASEMELKAMAEILFLASICG